MKARAKLATFAVFASLFAFVLAGCGWRGDGAGDLWRIIQVSQP